MGRAIPAINPFFASKSYDLLDICGDGEANIGDTILYSIQISNPGLVPINGFFTTKDTLVSQLTYVLSSTQRTYNGSTTAVGDIVFLGSSPFVFDEYGLLQYLTLNPGTNCTYTFKAVINAIPAGGSMLNRAYVTRSGVRLPASVKVPVVTYIPVNPVITTQPANGSICIGSSRVFSVVASGGLPPLTYQWQYNNSGTWANVTDATPTGTTYTGGTTTSLTVSGNPNALTSSYRVVVSSSPNFGCGGLVSATATLTVNAFPTATISGATVTCNGGTTTVTAAGGGTYLWSSSETSAAITKAAGTYTVTVTLNGCTSTASVTISNANTTANFTQTSQTCVGATAQNNGKITLVGYNSATHFGVSTLNAATYDGPAFASATAIVGNPDVKTSIPNTGGYYIVRIFNGSSSCYIDQAVVVAAVLCICPPNCSPTGVIKN